MSTGAGNLGVLVSKIAAVLRDMEPIVDPSIFLRHLFRDFLFYCSVLGFNSSYAGAWRCQEHMSARTRRALLTGLWPDDWFHSVCQISVKTPVLTAASNLKTEIIENAAIKLDLLPSVSAHL